MRKTLDSNLQKASKFKSNTENKKTIPHIFGYVDLRDLVFVVERCAVCVCMFVGIDVPFSSITSTTWS